MSVNTSILPCILSVKDVLMLPREIIECFTSITTKDVETYLNAFLRNADISSDKADKEAAEKIRDVYKDYYDLIEYVNSEEMIDTIQLVANTNLIDITYNTEDSVLIKLKTKFNSVLEGEDKLIKLDEDNFQNVKKEMMELAYNTGDDSVIRITRELTKNMGMMSSIFINKGSNAIQSSRLTSALKFKEKMLTLLAAIEDVSTLKSRGQGDVNPKTWRCF